MTDRCFLLIHVLWYDRITYNVAVIIVIKEVLL